MERLIIFITPLFLSASILQTHCDRCHKQMIPYTMIYKRALLQYSSKKRIQKALASFLVAPSYAKSILPPGLKQRFSPNNHPTFPPDLANKAIKELIEQEDILKKFR